MSVFSKTKQISKYLIYFSVVAISFSVVTFLFSRNQISADTNTGTPEQALPKNTGYQIVPDSSKTKVEYILAKDVDTSAIRDYKNFFYTHVSKLDSNQCGLLESDSCYKLSVSYNPNDWKYASYDQDKPTPDLSFLNEIYQKIERFNGSNEPYYQTKYRQDKELLDQISDVYTTANFMAVDSETGVNNYWFSTVLNQPRSISVMRYYHPNLRDGISSPNITPEAGEFLTLSAISWQDPQIPSEDWDLLSESYLKARFKGVASDMDKIKKIQQDYQSAVQDNPNNKLDYLLSEDSGTSTLYLVNASAPALEEHRQYEDLKYIENQLETIRIEHDGYWEFTNSGDWNGASLESPFTPEWSFLNEIFDRAKRLGDLESVSRIELVIKRYIADAHGEWDNVRFIPEIEPTSIQVKDQNFFDHLLQKYPNIPDCGDNCDFEKIDGTDAIVLNIDSNYQDATKDSVWHQSMLYILNSALKSWEDVGQDVTEERDHIERALELYLSIAEKESVSNEFISLEYPGEIYLDNNNPQSYKFNITANLPEPEADQEGGRFIVKLFLKPHSNKSRNIFIYDLLPVVTSGEPIIINWSGISDIPYTEIENSEPQEYSPTFTDGSAYDTSFPQKYYLKAQLSYQLDESEEPIDFVEATFETVDNRILSSSNLQNNDDGTHFTIAGPISAVQGEQVPVTVTAKDDRIKKAILYACTGKREEVIAEDSSLCRHLTESGSSAQDAIKGVMATPEMITEANEAGADTTGWKVMSFDSENEAETVFDWDTTGSIVGYHSLMIKAFSGNGLSDYIDDSKKAIEIAISDIDIPESQADRETNSGLVEFGSSFFDINQPVTSLSSLFSRIKSTYYWLIGILAFAGLLYGGFQYLASGGNAETVAKGQKTIMYTIVGLVLASIAYGLVTAIIDTINQIF